MSATVKKWEAAWHPGRKRWYYQDRVSGTAFWCKPLGCNITLPLNPPTDAGEDIPPPPEEPPEGWKAVFCFTRKRYYYYNVAFPSERSWLRPDKAAAGAGGARPSGASETKQPEVPQKPKSSVPKDHFFVNSVWDADSFRHRVQEAHLGKDIAILKKIFMELVESNVQLLTGRISLPVPVTSKVRWTDCIRALEDKTIEDYGADPKITIGSTTVAEAVHFFAGQDTRRVVCCLSQADGERPGGGYINGDIGWEEDLCRRVPALQTSLDRSSKECYKFGPSTCSSPSDPAEYADVLYTPRIALARGNEDEGFPIRTSNRRPQISVISAAAPKKLQKGEPATLELLTSSVMSIFIAPVYKEPRCTTLVLGPWGCGLGVPSNEMAALLVKGLIGELPGLEIKLGRLYHEVHFAIPPELPEHAHTKGGSHSSATEDLMETFLAVLRHERVPFAEL